MPQVVKADQQVAAQPHAFPTHKEQSVVGCQDQEQHEKHEQIHVREEAEVALFMRHVAGGVDVDEEANAGDNEQHNHGQMIDLQIEADGQILVGNDPVNKVFREWLMVLGVVIEEFANGLESAEKRQAGGTQSHGVNGARGPVPTKNAVDR